jgi:cold shock CspA family protein
MRVVVYYQRITDGECPSCNFKPPARQSFIQSIGVLRVSEVIGRVKFVSPAGFLFLTREDGQGGVFSHIREFEANGLVEPQQGDRFAFEIQDRPKGPVAAKPRPVL